MSVIVDSNVILDILTKDRSWYEWSSKKLAEYAAENDLIINQIIYAEISIRFSKMEELDEVLKEANIRSVAKDREMSDLMKGLSDIQKTGKSIEDVLKTQKKSVEVKINQLKNEVSSLYSEISIT